MNILALYQSAREVTADDRFIGPLIKLARRGNNAVVISTGLVDTTHSLEHRYVKEASFPFFPSFVFLFQSFFAALSLTKRKRTDLLLVYREEDLLTGWLISKLRNCRLIYYAHGDSITIQWYVSNSIINKLKVSVLVLMEKSFLNKADLIIAVSKDTKARLLARVSLPSGKVAVVYNNVLSPVLHSRPLVKKDKKIIGFVGHFSHLKGVDTLLEAFFILSQSLPNAELVLIGDGPLKKDLEVLSRQMNLQDKVIFTGYTKNPLDYIRDFDVLVVPSLYEACPSVILEAFSLDIPVFGSNAGGIPELLGNRELLFTVMTKEDIASKLESFLTSGENQLIIKKVIMHRKQMFTFDNTSAIEQLLMQSVKRNVA